MTGAAVVGMLVATAATLLAAHCVARHRNALPRECRGRGGALSPPGHPRITSVPLSVPRAARPALPHVSVRTPSCHRAPAPVTPPCCPPARAGAQEPVGVPDDAETAARTEDEAGTAPGNNTRGLNHPPW